MRSPSDYPVLKAFLTALGRTADALTYHELQGFLFTIAVCPDAVSPGEWVPVVFGGVRPRYASREEADTVLSELLAMHDAVVALTRGDTDATLPADCTFREPALANLERSAPIAQWARGFLQGHRWLEQSWEPLVPEDIADDYSAMVMALSFFASKSLAEAYRELSGPRDLGAMAEAMRQLFPDAAAGYAQLGRFIQTAIEEVDAEERDG